MTLNQKFPCFLTLDVGGVDGQQGQTIRESLEGRAHTGDLCSVQRPAKLGVISRAVPVGCTKDQFQTLPVNMLCHFRIDLS